mmetsp:Transcript_3233/g.9292  ORF Transcript_3233/g.9292 Transcript_3233/m.9292 type:complete len:327 (+) Transcript_3233:138-1118(+)
MTKYTTLPTAAPVAATAVGAPSGRNANDPYSISDDDYSNLPVEARNKTWGDAFFDLEESSEIIAVFDFDYATMEDFNTKVGFASLAAFCLYPPILGVAMLGCTPCFLRRNVEWSARSQHVALTRDGIRFVRDRRKTCWGLPCTDAGRSSKTVPYDKITDCDIEEPAGNTCLCIANVLTTVNIDTASSGGPGNHKELNITGLQDPVGFKKLVWAMKRHNNTATANGGLSQQPIMAESMHRDAGSSSKVEQPSHQEGESISLLLREIRDELRELRKSGDAGGIGGGAASTAATVEAATEMVNMVAISTSADERQGTDNEEGSSSTNIV